MKAEVNKENVISYFVGNFRYKLYYSKYFKWLIRNHIKKQIEFRINVMDTKCYLKGSCKLCGCNTTALQMAKKSCDKPCYPPLVGKKVYKKMYEQHEAYYINGNKWRVGSMKREIWSFHGEIEKETCYFVELNNQIVNENVKI